MEEGFTLFPYVLGMEKTEYKPVMICHFTAPQMSCSFV